MLSLLYQLALLNDKPVLCHWNARLMFADHDLLNIYVDIQLKKTAMSSQDSYLQH